MRTYQQLNHELSHIDTHITSARSRLVELESQKRHIEYLMCTYDSNTNHAVTEATAHIDDEWAGLIQALT